jgi:hypothetical protein
MARHRLTDKRVGKKMFMPIDRENAYVPRWESTRPEPSFLRDMSLEPAQADEAEEKETKEGLDVTQKGLVLLGAVLVAFSIFMDIRNYFL